MHRRSASLGVVLGVVLALAAAVGGHAATGARPGGASRGDSLGVVRVTSSVDRQARVLGVTGDHDPAVTRTTPVRVAALAGLERYAGLVGVDDPLTHLVAGPVTRSVTGDDVVRFTQTRAGLPVIGGSVAVDLRPDRQLGSLTASVSRATVPPASYPASGAAREALAVAAKRLGSARGLLAGPPQHRLYDPAVLGVRRTSDPTTHARGVWWVEVHAGSAFHRAVLVDDRTGGVVLDVDLLEPLDRVVCDDHNFMTELDLPCTKDFARTEHGPLSRPSRVADVNHAFDLAGVVARFYHRIGGLHLTRLLGVDEGDHRSLSSTVRYCDPFQPAGACPLANAFWNGVGMFYGQGYASADDVVGHEMTHGVIQHNADLFYWGQSGAINESLADVMGEIIDHQHRGKGDSPHSWTIGEDLPRGAIRSLRNPRRFGQPESTASRLYAPSGDVDNGGVHTNSGVGNRTFYLISQGGTQHGRHLRGIDHGSLRKSATLYLDVIQHLMSGSDYRDLAAVLSRSCHDLVRHHRVGMTHGDCHQVRRATRATHLHRSPRHAKQPANARMSCPQGSGSVHVLFDSEKGDPAAGFDAGSTWVRAPDSTVYPPVSANAVSGHTSWFSSEPQDTTVSSLTMHPVTLPAGHPAYLWFQQWRLLEAGTDLDGTHVNYDGGTVEVADATRGGAPAPAEGLPWVNGPQDVITDQFGNPSAGRVSFSRDSHGYLASRLSLTSYAGDTVSPQFTMNTDNDSTEVGWYLDDIRVYSCS